MDIKRNRKIKKNESNNKNLSPTFKFLRTIGLNYSVEEYGNVTLREAIVKALENPYHALLLSMMNWVIFEPISPRMLRPWLLRRMGAKVGKGVFIGDHVFFDLNHANLITLDDYAHVTGGCRLLCHQRNLSDYHVGDNAAMCGYKLGKIHIGKGCMIGMTTMIMPGVTIGDGAIVGAGSLVTKDIPAWTIATGRPAKVVKSVPERKL